MKKDKSIHNPLYQSLIESLANERKRLNISQSELAIIVGLNQSDVSKIELLERRLDVLEFASILNVYRIHENKKLSELVVDFLGLSK